MNDSYSYMLMGSTFYYLSLFSGLLAAISLPFLDIQARLSLSADLGALSFSEFFFEVSCFAYLSVQ